MSARAPDDAPESFGELLALYELALSVGRSLDLVENCRSFLSVLERCKEVAYAAIWLYGDGDLAPSRARLAYGHPAAHVADTELDRDHPMFTTLGDAAFACVASGEPGFASVGTERGLEGGAYALFRLRDLGVLKLFSRREDAFARRELSPLRHVVDRLAVALEASLAHRALQREYSERLRAEDALRLGEARFRDFADTAADWFWETDAQLRVSYVSESHDRATGMEAARVVGRTPQAGWLSEAASADDRVAFLHDLEARRTLDRCELRWRGADGVERVHSFSGKPIFDPDGVFLGFRGSARDVTARALAEAEHARLEGQLKQAQKMEAIGQLTGGIAHDFNNILATVLGFTELARDAVSPADARLDRYLEEIQVAGERARNLVAQMLTFSRGGTGEVVELAVAPVLEEATRLLRSTLPSTIEVSLSVLSPDATIESEGVSLQQVLLNLCINARDAMSGQKGRIGIVLEEESGRGGRCDSCEGEIAGPRVVLTVRDTGSGIDEAIRSRIFDPFFTTKPPGKGTGMGLSMVHGIVHRHDGHIQVGSELGCGTTIRIHWPALGTPVKRSPPPPRIRLVPGRGERILVVDDEATVGAALGEILAQRGYAVEVSDSPEEAADRARSRPCPFDLIVTDQTMPAMTGLELIERVRAVHPGLPVILCSGYGDAVAEDGAIGEGSMFLRKPLSASELVLGVQSLLARPAVRAPGTAGAERL